VGVELRANRLRRLRHVLVARLVVILLVLGAALAITATDRAELMAPAERGLYRTLVGAFLASIAFALVHRRMQSRRAFRRFTGLQLAVDIAVVTALVHFSGGSESIFSFLYVPIAVYAALLAGRGGAYAASASAALVYGGLFLVYRSGFGGIVDPNPQVESLRLTLWGVHAGAILLVALLSSALVAERDRADRALDQRTRDLNRLQRLHDRIVESLTSGLLTIDAAGHVTSFNPEAERITGLAADAAIGKTLDAVLPGARERGVLSGPERDRGKIRLRLEVERPGGEVLHIGLSGSSLRPIEGDSPGHVLIFQDLTEVVEMERALRRGERMAAVGELSARLAHEIRNPLAAISGSIEMLDGTPAESEDRARLQQIVLRETERLDSLITDFLQYARPAPPAREPVCLARVVREVGEMLEGVRTEEIEVAVEVEPELWVRADEGQLRQVVWNLCRNAFDAMPAAGRLELTARRCAPQGPDGEGRSESTERGDRVEIAVSDSGVGIPGDVVEHIFDPFFTTKKSGSGLGLAIVHRIVEASGGSLSVASTPGAGTHFRIELPAVEAAELAAQTEPTA